ncbi:Winged helix DNA-binding domain-containing protein [Geodermatophilus telluris]|uniref:Winged helix DNA-binding domain-containing protein n=1 Tax=Geodermatophilus telluris TaxID=1190417 RepID=A0A1G6MUM2_9ACTN|nr:winged helix DNA-binding domain-containing protein [Geodermatophilus telluris]SDC58685.1 Winged helix DNA-binding domain-containing protein [Geodermatophilus telluris]
MTVPRVSPREVALLRLVAQRVAGPPFPDAAAAVRGLLAVQGQELPGALTSVALRTAGRSGAGVSAALDTGAVVRSWPMRGTLHLTAAEDLPWLLDLLGGRVLAGAAKRRAVVGLTLEDLERARGVAVAALSGGRRLGRRELLAALADGGCDVAGQKGYHSLWFLAQTGTLVLGPTAGGDQAFVLLEEWVREPRRPTGEEALAELALRFFTGHGPAGVADLVRWAGTTVRDARAGLALVRDRLAAVDADGTELLLDPEVPERLAACRAEAEDLHLLPGFDEVVLGYADRSCTVPPEFADRIVPGGNGVFRPTVVVGGRAVGTWRWTGTGARRRVEAEPFTAFPEGVADRVPELAAALP